MGRIPSNQFGGKWGHRDTQQSRMLRIKIRNADDAMCDDCIYMILFRSADVLPVATTAIHS